MVINALINFQPVSLRMLRGYRRKVKLKTPTKKTGGYKMTTAFKWNEWAQGLTVNLITYNILITMYRHLTDEQFMYIIKIQ